MFKSRASGAVLSGFETNAMLIGCMTFGTVSFTPVQQNVIIIIQDYETLICCYIYSTESNALHVACTQYTLFALVFHLLCGQIAGFHWHRWISVYREVGVGRYIGLAMFEQ